MARYSPGMTSGLQSVDPAFHLGLPVGQDVTWGRCAPDRHFVRLPCTAQSVDLSSRGSKKPLRSGRGTRSGFGVRFWAKQGRRDPGPSYGGVGPSYERVWGLKSLRFEGPRAVNGASGCSHSCCQSWDQDQVGALVRVVAIVAAGGPT